MITCKHWIAKIMYLLEQIDSVFAVLNRSTVDKISFARIVQKNVSQKADNSFSRAIFKIM